MPFAKAASAADVRALLENLDAATTPGKDVQAILDALPALSNELRVRLEQTRAAGLDIELSVEGGFPSSHSRSPSGSGRRATSVTEWA